MKSDHLASSRRSSSSELPIIPLWYNGLWAQASNAVWTNWPSAEPGAPKSCPSTWRDYWEMGGIRCMLTQLQPAG